MERFKGKGAVLSLAAAVALVGCSDSGGGNGPTTGDPGSGETTVAGSAAKGVMQQAPVTIHQLNDSGDRVAELVSTRTDADGAYEASLPGDYDGQALEIVVGADDQTSMICDASRCADGISRGDTWSDLPSDFELTSVIASASQAEGEISAPVSAWTSMAASRARTLVGEGGDLQSSSRQASAEVSEFAGFDVASTNAKGASQLEEGDSSPEESQGAVMNSAVAEVVFSGGDSEEETQSVSERLKSFTQSMDDGSAGGEEDSFSTEDLSEATRTASESVPNLDEDTQSNLNNQTARYDSAQDGFEPSYDPEKDLGEDATQEERIAAFQDFVSEVRGWVRGVEDLDSDALSTAVQADVDTLQQVLNGDLQNQLQVVALTGSQVAEHLSTNTEAVVSALENGDTLTVNILDGTDQSIGDVTLDFARNQNGNLRVVATSDFQNSDGTEYLPLDLTLDSNIAVDQLDLASQTFTQLGQETRLELSGSIGNQNTGIEFDGTELVMQLSEATDVEGTSASEEVNAVFERGSMTGQINANVESGEAFEGEVAATLVRLDESANYSALNQDPVSLKSARLSGSFTSADGNQFSTSAQLDVNNAGSFDTFAWFNDSGEYRQLPLDLPYEELVQFLPERPEGEIRLPSASVSRSYDSDANTKYQAFSSWWEAGDSPVTNTYGMSVDQKDELKQTMLAETTGNVTFTAFASDGTERTFTVPFSDLFDRVDQFEFSSGSGAMLNVTALPTNQQLLEADEINAEVTGSQVTGRFSDFNMGMYRVQLPETGETIQVINYTVSNPVAGDVDWLSQEIEKFLPSGAEHQNTMSSFSENPDYALDSTYTIAGSLDAFDLCEADTDAELSRLLGIDPNSFLGDARRCAEATLNQAGATQPAPVSAEEYEPLVFDALEPVFGADLMNQVAVQRSYSSLDLVAENAGTRTTVRIPELDTQENFVKAALTLSSSVDMPELPDASVTATVTRSSFTGGRILANVDWNEGNYTVELRSEDFTGAGDQADIRFYNPQGYELALSVSDEDGDGLDVTGNALIDDEEVGTVRMRNGLPVIEYPNDDTTRFESLM